MTRVKPVMKVPTTRIQDHVIAEAGSWEVEDGALYLSAAIGHRGITCSVCGPTKLLTIRSFPSRDGSGGYHVIRGCGSYLESISKAARAKLSRVPGYEPPHRGSCPICEEEADLVWDHCHLSGRHRGKICRPCNSVLGLARDKPMILRAAARYLDQAKLDGKSWTRSSRS